MITKEQIKDITKIIVDTVQPRKVYLIGSYATGKASEESDLDFLIIAGSEDIPKYERTTAIQKKLFHLPQISIDLMMFTEAEVKEKINIAYSFIGHALKNGEVVYES